MTQYQMCINNVSNYIINQPRKDVENNEGIDAFEASTILAIAFCKTKEEVIGDIIRNNSTSMRL